jgi:hypothetical protein
MLLVVRCASAADVLLLDPEPNEGLTGGVPRQYTDLDGPFQAHIFFGDINLLSVGFIGPVHAWFVTVAAPAGQVLTPGYYDDAGDPPAPFLTVSGDGLGGISVGRFFVFELALDASGAVERFAADFQYGIAPGARLFGAIRYHSDWPISRPCGTAADDADADGELDSNDRCPDTPAGETVDDSGCSVAQYCAAIDASTRDGRRFCRAADWRNDGLGRRRLSRDCTAIPGPGGIACVARAPASRPWATLTLAGEPGDYVTGGLEYHFTSANGPFQGSRYFANSALISFNGVAGGEGHNWSVVLGAPGGALLTPGTYQNAERFPSEEGHPWMDVFGDGRGCNTITGKFDVTEVVYGPYQLIDRLSATFEQHCEGGVPALRGAIDFARPIVHGLTCLDQDGDGEPDASDACPGTEAATDVDAAGCSRAQFCSAIDPATTRASLCGRADWRGDSPRRAPRDCQLATGACVPR